jgi:glycosyltransferase involved in cell wall biosynthesis
MKFPGNFSGRIIQVAESLDFGDAVSNHVIAIDGLLKRLGFESFICSKWHHEKVREHWVDLALLDAREGDVVLLHYCGYSEFALPAVLASYATRVMIYHNITPAEFFDPKSALYEFCLYGREQLAQIIGKFHQFWGVSNYNLDELKALGAPPANCHLLPIVVPPQAGVRAGAKDPGTWLFVGRVAPNKKQLELVELFAEARRTNPAAARHLYLVGNPGADDSYARRLQHRITQLGLGKSVTLTGKVEDAERDGYYRCCAVFVCLSEHEGFGVPLVEAPLRGIPVVAMDNSAVGETMGGQHGLARSRKELVDLLVRIAGDQEAGAELLAAQRRNARRFEPDTVLAHLSSALTAILPAPSAYQTVSIVICTYNRRPYMERVLDYLSFQTSGAFEVVVVDGPSDDGTKELLAGIEGRIKVAHNPERNLSKSRNIGIELASGDIVAFIDDDALPFDTWVEQLLAGYNARPLTVHGMGGPTFYAGTLRFQATDTGFNKMADAMPDIPAERVGKDGWVRTLLGTNSSFTRDALLECGGFDEQYDYFLDESDVCWRIQQANGLLAYNPSLFLRHEFAESDNRRSKHNFNWFAICKNTAYFVAGHSGLTRKELLPYLKERLQRERVEPLLAGVKDGELSKAECDTQTRKVWDGMQQGLADARHFPRTRPLRPRPGTFLPYAPCTRVAPARPSRPLHVCIVTKEFPLFSSRGGIGTLYHHLAAELLLMGHSVTVITPGAAVHEVQQGPFRLIYAPPRDTEAPDLETGFRHNINWAGTALATLHELSKKHLVDVVETALWDTEALAIAVLPAARRPPVVLRLVTPFPVAARLNGWKVPEAVAAYFTAAEQELISHVDALVPISDSIADTIQSEYGLAGDPRWSKIPCGIAYWPSFDVKSGYASLDDFKNVPPDVLRSDKLVVFLGRLEQRKGIDLLLDAADEILGGDPDAVLLIAGRDVENWEPRLPDLVDRRYRARVHLLGEVTDAAREKLLARAHCVVFPSRYESFGLVPLEAFVHGVPVVASASGAIPEVVLDGECGVLFEPEDAQSLAAAVASLLRDPALRARLSAGALARVRTLSSRSMAQRSVELYTALVEPAAEAMEATADTP